MRVIGRRSRFFGDGCGTRSLDVRAAVVVYVSKAFEPSVAVLGESRNGLGIFARRGTWRFRVVELEGSRHRGTWHNPHSRALVGEDLGASKAKQQKKPRVLAWLTAGRS